MGTISSLKDWLARKSRASQPPVVVSAYGFTVGENFVAWQAVSEVWCYKTGRTTADQAFLEFNAAGLSLHVGEEQAGFADLEAAMIAVFPGTAAWRQAVLATAFAPNKALLYRRP